MKGHEIRLATEQLEREVLSPFAAKASESQGRLQPIPEDPVRTCFQRDRDRILHSKAFRRLKHKTQVFIDPKGDHYRTRLTHTLEVAQIARTVSRALRLNEDLTEAIALGHDVGHTPFGHAGESALNEAIQEARRERWSGWEELPEEFRHYEQSLREVDILSSLNLTYETRMGIGGHSKGRGDLTAHDGQPTSTLEAAVVRISDRIAYLNHDLDDALRSGIIAEIPKAFRSLGDSHGERLGNMVQDLISASLGKPRIALTNSMARAINDLKEWLFENVYLEYPNRFPEIRKAKEVVKYLFRHYARTADPPLGFPGLRGAVDYVAGMTDRFATQRFIELTVPREFDDEG
ncbi:MAG: deoxyguanosinetriphosphate triphosphohydrolase [Fimbriimonadales bacterium]|nr:deoxyguanosinetriphosphate triphosphohydrolase [Fimbriimonadales bacterium]